MKRVLLLLAFTFLLSSASAQEMLMDTEDVYESDAIAPKFNNGGLDKFYDFINENFDFATVTKPGTMVATFSIDVTGALTNIRITEFVEADAAAEYIRVLMLSPKWESAKRSGKPFSVKIRLPLRFKK